MMCLAGEVSSRENIVSCCCLLGRKLYRKTWPVIFMAVARSPPLQQSWAVTVQMVTKPQALTDLWFKENHLLI